MYHPEPELTVDEYNSFVRAERRLRWRLMAIGCFAVGLLGATLV